MEEGLVELLSNVPEFVGIIILIIYICLIIYWGYKSIKDIQKISYILNKKITNMNARPVKNPFSALVILIYVVCLLPLLILGLWLNGVFGTYYMPPLVVVTGTAVFLAVVRIIYGKLEY